MHARPAPRPVYPEEPKTIAVYILNASGKSVLLKALQALQTVILHKESTETNPIARIRPFAFRSKKKEEELLVWLSVELLLDGVPYEYALSVERGVNGLESLRRHGGGGRRWRQIFTRTLATDVDAPAYAYLSATDSGPAERRWKSEQQPTKPFSERPSTSTSKRRHPSIRSSATGSS